MQDLVIVGVGGWGRGVHNIVEAVNEASSSWNFLGIFRERPRYPRAGDTWAARFGRAWTGSAGRPGVRVSVGSRRVQPYGERSRKASALPTLILLRLSFTPAPG